MYQNARDSAGAKKIFQKEVATTPSYRFLYLQMLN